MLCKLHAIILEIVVRYVHSTYYYLLKLSYLKKIVIINSRTVIKKMFMCGCRMTVIIDFF